MSQTVPMSPLVVTGILALAIGLTVQGCAAQRYEQLSQWPRDLEPLARTVDLAIGQSQEVALADGRRVTVKLVDLKETRDGLRDAVRRAEVTVEVAGRRATLVSATYRLPQTVGDVQIDCPITRGYVSNSRGNPWALDKDARLRLWPKGSPWIQPGTFGYPVGQRWFASDTQMANEPTFVDGVESPGEGKIYYHSGLDFGGAEDLVDVLAAAEAVVCVAGKEKLAGYDGAARADRVVLQDRRGWRYNYDHLVAIDPAVQPGVVVKLGRKIGSLGKEGDSGGWSHLHFATTSMQPSGRFGADDAYAYAWQAGLAEQKPQTIAVARPHHFLWSGESAALDGSRSWAADGQPLRYEWTFSDGAKAERPTQTRVYPKAGEYSEILKVTDAAGHVAYDFAVVQVIDRVERDKKLPPGIHAVYYPTTGLRAGQTVTFKVRTFGTTSGEETWDFGDGATAKTKSDGNVNAWAKDGYAVTQHAYSAAGDYIVTVRRTSEHNLTATTHLWVHVGK